MPQKRSWTEGQLIVAVENSRSVRQVLIALNLIPIGGNYATIKQYIYNLELNIDHFKGQGWHKGEAGYSATKIPLDKVLIVDSEYQSFKLRNRLYEEGLKVAICELCGWAEKSVDGRIPVELDHINGDHRDNRIENLRILCPNCHSLQSTHRGRNKKVGLSSGRVL